MLQLLADVTAKPDPTGLPGSNVLQQLVNGAEAWALAIALLGAFVGAALWAVASHAHNPHYAARGRMAAVISAAAALVDRVGARARELLPAPGDDREMRRPARIAATGLVTLASALAPTAGPAAAAVSPDNPVCGAAGLFSGPTATAAKASRTAAGCSRRASNSSPGNVGGAVNTAVGRRRTVDRLDRRHRARARARRRVVLGAAEVALNETAAALGRTTTPQLHTTWFSSTYWRMAAIAAC